MSQSQEDTIKKYEVDTDGDVGNDAPATAPVSSVPSSPADPIPMSEHQSPWQDDGKDKESGEETGDENDTEQEVREG